MLVRNLCWIGRYDTGCMGDFRASFIILENLEFFTDYAITVEIS